MVQKIKGSQIEGGTIGADELEPTAVTPGVYGDTSNVPQITIDQDGRITAVTEIAISGAGLTVEEQDGAPTVSGVTTIKVTNGTLTDDGGGEVSINTGGGGISDGDKGDITVSSSGAVWTIDNDVVTNAKAANMATDTIKGRATAGTGDPEDLTALPFAFTGDVTRAADSNSQVIANDAVTNAQLANVATDTIKGRATAGTGDPEDLTSLPFAFTGDVTRPADSNVQTLAAGSASVLNSGTLPAGRMPALTGDVTTSVGAVATTIANDAVSYAKMQNVSAASRILGRGSDAGAGNVEELTLGAGLSLVNTEIAATGTAAVLDVNVTEVGNVGSGEDNLITYSVVANTLGVNEEYLHFVASGIFAANGNNKTVKVYLGSTLLFSTGAVAFNGADWTIEGWIVREGASVQKCITKFNSSSTLLPASSDYVGATEDLTTTLTFKLTGEATSNNDIVQELLVVEKGGGAGGSSAELASASYKRTAGDYTTTSTTFVDVDSTNLSLTITTGAHRVLIGFSGTVRQSDGNDNIFLDVTVDGTRQGGSIGLIGPRSAVNVDGSFTFLTDVLSAGSHTFKLQWRVLATGTATIAGGSTGELYSQFYVIEQNSGA